MTERPPSRFPKRSVFAKICRDFDKRLSEGFRARNQRRFHEREFAGVRYVDIGVMPGTSEYRRAVNQASMPPEKKEAV